MRPVRDVCHRLLQNISSHALPASTTSAEDWNLGEPLKTCNLLVERRGDLLVLEFLSGDSVFCQSSVDLRNGKSLQQWLEPVVDSSRYFVVKIQGAGNKQATIGFGFRSRDEATDLRESVQHYQKSMQREEQAKSGGGETFSIPKLAADEKIHVGKNGKTTITKIEKSKSNAVPLLKKKPPAASPEQQPKESVEKKVEKMSIQMGDINLDAGAENNGGDESEGAVYEGDEEQWATEFAMS